MEKFDWLAGSLVNSYHLCRSRVKIFVCEKKTFRLLWKGTNLRDGNDIIMIERERCIAEAGFKV